MRRYFIIYVVVNMCYVCCFYRYFDSLLFNFYPKRLGQYEAVR